MGYESPIEMIYGQMRIESENAICKAVQNVGVNVDKEKLIRALQYDREQYQKGYKDRDEEIVRCKDCIHGVHFESEFGHDIYECDKTSNVHEPNWFCADGKQKICGDCRRFDGMGCYKNVFTRKQRFEDHKPEDKGCERFMPKGCEKNE